LAAAAGVGIVIALLAISLVVSQLYVSGLTEATCPDWKWTPEDFGLPSPRDVAFTSADGIDIRGWYFPGSNGVGIVLAGGIGTRKGMLPEASILAQRGYGVLLFDWRGCGASGQAIRTLGYREALDLAAAADYMKEQPGTDRVGALGFSVGGAAAIRAAAENPDIGAVVAMGNYYDLEADIYGRGEEYPLLSGLLEREVAWLFQRKTGINFDRDLEPVDLVPQISPRPLLLIYGELEEHPPPSHGQTMFQAAREPKEFWVLPNVGHGGYYHAQPEEFTRRVVSFFDAALLH
jgi:dipeptidyl aminopeptidase/acylaminoacyl peptidase